MIRIALTSVLVDDQQKALEFYVGTLGFRLKQDLPVGDHRWLTVVSPADPDGTELLLEPVGFAPARTYQKALHDAGIPLTAFRVDDLAAEHRRLTGLGVAFRAPPTAAGPVRIALIEDGCGNLIQLFQPVDGQDDPTP